MTPRPSTSETAWNILADSTPQLARPAANRPPNDPRRPSSPPKVIATPSRQERDGSPGPVAQTLTDRTSNHDTPPAPAAPPQEPAATERSPRYRVGCAGMFELGTDWGCNDEDEAIAGCLEGPPGCEVLDTQTGQWIGPYCLEEAQEARARIEARREAADNEFDRAADPDMRWVDHIVRDAENTAAESRRRPLYREGLLTPERRPVVRCADCDLEREPDERDCSQCGSERVLQEVPR